MLQPERPGSARRPGWLGAGVRGSWERLVCSSGLAACSPLPLWFCHRLSHTTSIMIFVFGRCIRLVSCYLRLAGALCPGGNLTPPEPASARQSLRGRGLGSRFLGLYPDALPERHAAFDVLGGFAGFGVVPGGIFVLLAIHAQGVVAGGPSRDRWYGQCYPQKILF